MQGKGSRLEKEKKNRGKTLEEKTTKNPKIDR
jgi:hypothetical protein